MAAALSLAPGAPGVPARWTSSAKVGVGTALSPASPLWFTVSHGILNEVYYPRPDSACIRDLGLIVMGPAGRFGEEKRDARHEVAALATGAPAYRLTNTAQSGAWCIRKRIVSDPARPCVLQHVSFTPILGGITDYRLYALLAPHLVNAGMGNTAWIDTCGGTPILFATGRGTALALACSVPWGECSAGYVGYSDGWQRLSREGDLLPACHRADDGNVALTGEIRLSNHVRDAVLALGFGADPAEAAEHALASLESGFPAVQAACLSRWQAWQETLLPLDRGSGVSGLDPYRVSTTVLASHCATSPRGAAVASLSIPWGAVKGDDDLGGYHLVWPRDLVETAGGFLAAGAGAEALAILRYLRTLQRPDGHWPQNAWLDGTAYWPGIQMDECAFPILLVESLQRSGHLTASELDTFMPMVERAAGYLIRNGPVTGEDRWEEDPGYSPFTLAVEIVALLIAADLLDASGRHDDAVYLRETADCWNTQIEDWTYVEHTPLATAHGVTGYYVRIGPSDAADAASPKDGYVPIKNRLPSDASRPARQVVSPDALALVRFGLRAPDDPRIRNTVSLVDALLRCELPQGPLWYRYTDDGYGEHDDGTAFDGTGCGRPWPLLAGERAHYELAAGRRDEAIRLLEALEGSAGDGGLIPEQVWDDADVPSRDLIHGRPSGSAMPLVWAHAEHIKLLRSLREGDVFDMPPQGRARYIQGDVVSWLRTWRFSHRTTAIPAGTVLRIEVGVRAMVHWSVDEWATCRDSETRANSFGLHLVDVPGEVMVPGGRVVFTFYWLESGRWEHVDFAVAVGERESGMRRRPL
ncbi:MAG: glucan 1,4-alpha-glucosidase [Acidobacteria bacterium SCN 69-37]|nr:MAG: glucan 1,4-alpha-glucosidase [Acidobacteria bacterium SCN 69-37]